MCFELLLGPIWGSVLELFPVNLQYEVVAFRTGTGLFCLDFLL